MNSYRLYVGNLAFDATEQDVRENFAEAGDVVEVKIIQDRATGQSRGFGFVCMATDEQGALAIEMLNGREICGRKIRVSIAKARANAWQPTS